MTDPITPVSPPAADPAQQPASVAAQPTPVLPAADQAVPVVIVGKRNGMAIAALVLGIIAFVGAFIPFLNYVTGVVALVGLILGIIAIVQKHASKPLAITGTAISFAALILSIILAVAYSAIFLSAANSVAHEDDPQGHGASGSSPKPSAASTIGTRANPASIGSTVDLKSAGAVDWEVTLGAPTLNADALVASANEFNEAPPAGDQYALVPVTVVYKGKNSDSPLVSIIVDFVTADGVTHTSSDTLVVPPDPAFDSIGQLYTGAKATGNVVIAVPSANVDKGTWAVSETFGSSPYFFKAQ